MKIKLIVLLLASLVLSACASTKTVVTPLPPTQENVNALKSDYRKTVEVLLIGCSEKETGSYVNVQPTVRKAFNPNASTPIFQKVTETISVVETTKTGERFEMYGCWGKPGDRFRITY
jgi:PBP1b-binding outer membrane lipoprotein LpoB